MNIRRVSSIRMAESTKHKNSIDYTGGLPQLALDLSRLRYDALHEFLTELSENFEKDSTADLGRGRRKLAAALKSAAEAIGEAWKVCRPYEVSDKLP